MILLTYLSLRNTNYYITIPSGSLTYTYKEWNPFPHYSVSCSILIRVFTYVISSGGELLQETWGFLDSGLNDAATNMAIDESLLNWHSKGLIPPTLRFYGWSIPTLTCGQFQNVERTLDLEAVTRNNCEFVRRLTGGSAVLHDDELTYSIVVSEKHERIPKSVTEAYYVLSKGVLEGYKNLGVNADYSMPERKMLKERSAVCFEKSADYEMIVDGKKISGNAQTRKNGVLLQHGSIPMSIDEIMLFELFKFSKDSIRDRQRKSFSNKATTINEITQQKHTYEMLTRAFLEGFKTGIDIQLQPFELTEDQWLEVRELADTKYRTDQWNLNRNKERVNHGKENENKKE